MDQTTLAASLSIIGNALHASDKAAWISGGYFVYASLSLFISCPDLVDICKHLANMYSLPCSPGQNINLLPAPLWPSVGYLVS